MQKGLDKELKTLLIKINKNKPEQLTKEEIEFLEEQSDMYMDKYENYAFLLQIAEGLNDIKNIYKKKTNDSYLSNLEYIIFL